MVPVLDTDEVLEGELEVVTILEIVEWTDDREHAAGVLLDHRGHPPDRR